MIAIPHPVLAGVPVLLATARTRSANKAAEALGTTTATVLRRLAAMEAALGAELFERSPSGLFPTLALELVLPWAEQASAAASGMMQQVAGLEREPHGVVRLAMPPTMARYYVVPALGELHARYPKLTLDIAAASAVVDLVQREADLALRATPPAGADLVQRKLTSFNWVVVCAPALLPAAQRKRRDADLAKLPWLTWNESLSHIPEAAWLQQHVPHARVVLRASDLDTLLAAAQEGGGALVLPEPTAALAEGLVRVPTTLPLPSGGLWLVAHRALRSVPRVDAVWQWIIDTFEAMLAAGMLGLEQRKVRRRRRER